MLEFFGLLSAWYTAHRVKFTSVHHLVLSTLTGFTSQFIVLDFIYLYFYVDYWGTSLAIGATPCFLLPVVVNVAITLQIVIFYKNFVYMSNYVLCTIVIIFYVKVQGLKKKLR